MMFDGDVHMTENVAASPSGLFSAVDGSQEGGLGTKLSS